MNKQKLCIALLMLLGALYARAQQQELCICRQDSCDVFEVRHIGCINFANGIISVDRLRSYSVQGFDSIVFTRPQLTATELGWWGDLDEGLSRYELHYYDAELQSTYHVSFEMADSAGICQGAACTITFSCKEQKELFYEQYFMKATSEANNDPYIYVKETLTGPRKFEVWVMGSPLLPVDALLNAREIDFISDSEMIVVPLANQLAGRTMADVKLIIEGWVYNPLKQRDNPDYNPNKQ